MSSEIVPFVDGNDSPSPEPHHNAWKAAVEDLHAVSTKPSNTGKGKEVVDEHAMDEGKATVVEHAILRSPLGTIEEVVRPFDLLGLRSIERLDTWKRFWVEADLIGGNHDMRLSISPKKGPKWVTKFNPTPEFVGPLLEQIKVPSVLQLRGCDKLFSPYAFPFSFEKFKTLICLEICGVSNLTSFPENKITEMTQLQILNFSHLPIPQLSADFFSNLVYLRSLTLKDCPNLHFLPQLNQMNVLEYLELSHLPLQRLPTNFFSNLVRLRSLTLKDCPNIHFLPEPDQMNTNPLEYLELSHLLIATLPNGFFYGFEELRRIILRGCSKLTFLPFFKHLQQLRELDLSHCTALQDIELEEMSFLHVKELDLSYTALHYDLLVTAVPRWIIGLTHLFLRDAKVIDFQRFPNFLYHLKVLDVSGAQYMKHLDLLKISKALGALDLSRTRIESIDFISFMENLCYLILRDCTRLHKLPAMENLTHLEVLDISGCEILGELPKDFSSLKKLKELNLSGCSGLKESSPTLFDKRTFLENFPSLTNLRTLKISETPSNGKVDTLDLHPRLSKPNEFYIVSTFFINSGFDRFKQHFDLIVDLISRFEENFEPVSSLEAIPIIHTGVEDIDRADKKRKTDAESCPISGETVKMQCRRMVADLEYIRDNIGLLESCPSCTSADKLLDELTDARSQFEPWLFEDEPSDISHFYFRLNSTNFYEVLRRVAKLKQLVSPKQVDALEEKKNKEKEEYKRWVPDEQDDVIYVNDIDINTPEMQNLSSSYESLTNTQKNCLLHFTIFGKNWIKERRLIQLWYGEGLIDPQHEENPNTSANPLPTPNQNLNLDPAASSDPNQEITSASTEAGTPSITKGAPTIEEIGRKVLMVLQEKHFIARRDSNDQKASRFWTLPADVLPSVRARAMADVHSFVRARAMAEGFVNVNQETRMLTPHLSIGSQRACLLISQNNLPSSSKLWADYTNSSEKIKYFKTICTLLNVNARIVDIRSEWFSKMRDLFVFHLGRCKKHAYEPESIEVIDFKFLEELKNMKKLRLLNLEGFLAIKKLPDSVCKVTNLRILNLRECGYLEELPAGIGSLNNLTHLDLTDCHMLCRLPKGIRLLSKLEVLKGFVIYYQIGGRQHRNACTLRDLLKLEKLRILKLVVHTEKFPASSDLHVLNGMKNLCNLRITWKKNYNDSNKQSEDIVGKKASSSSSSRWHQLKCWEQRTSQNETEELLLRSNIKKLELCCFPFETVPNWLHPSGLQKLEKLYFRGGMLKTLARNTNQDTWNVKILSFMYLYNMKVDKNECKSNFPHMTEFHEHACNNVRILHSSPWWMQFPTSD